jgi:hypothetical protein
MWMFVRVVAIAALVPLFHVGARAGQSTVVPDQAIDAATKQRVIEGAIQHLRNGYVFADVADRMAAAILSRAERNEYEPIRGARAFVNALTRHLQEVSKDGHLRVLFNVEAVPERREASSEETERMRAAERRSNYGFLHVERLDGNVGYIELRGFSGSPEAGSTAVSAMNFVAGTDALIFDLRANVGGSPAMIGLLSSYLFDDVVHLNDFYVRESNELRQFWTSPHVQGQRYGSTKLVYILTSNRTFSAAEEFTYNLKNLKRAIVVGATTGGGAHPGGVRRIDDHFGIWIPNGRAINPVTGTNWEGTGVTPDITVASADALKVAYLDALRKLRMTATDVRQQQELDRATVTSSKN